MSSLPILTFDERVLNPRLGYVFDRRWLDPYESIVGMLWKFVRMNGIPGHAVVRHLCRHADPYEGVAPTSQYVDVRALARMLTVTQSCVREGLYSPASAHRGSRSFRYCTRCLSRGYHGASHQHERLLNCPAHGRPLETRCRHCQRTSDYRLDAQLLDTPFRCRHCAQNYAGARPMNIALRPPMAMKDRVAITRAHLA